MNKQSMVRSLPFSQKTHGRYWWFSATGAKYVPPVFAFLADEEWDLLQEWYSETEELYPHGTGECNVSAMSLLMGMIMGNNISRVAQCGHFIGFSTLLLGFMAKRMGHRHAVFSVDIDSDVTRYSQGWVARAQLDEHVRLNVGNSADVDICAAARDYLGGQPQVVFIDSSHAYAHTIAELELWYPELQPGGFIFLHDVSLFAVQFDAEKGRGVKDAVEAWMKGVKAQAILINDFCTDRHYGDATVYKDASGIGLIQKPN